MKVPPEYVQWWGDPKIAREMWKEEGRNDRERRKNWKVFKTHEDEKRLRRTEQKRQYGIKHRDDIKHETFRYYSKGGVIKCASCGFTDIRALSIHHVNGGGNQDRQEISHGGWNFYEMLKKAGWPEGYRVLCINCQFIASGRGARYILKERVFKHYSQGRKVLGHEGVEFRPCECRWKTAYGKAWVR